MGDALDPARRLLAGSIRRCRRPASRPRLCGGYRFHLNGALSELLGALGYDVTPSSGAGVHEDIRRAGADRPSSNHLVLTVTGLPVGRESVGRGTSMSAWVMRSHELVPLVPGEIGYGRPCFRMAIEATPGEFG